MAGRGRRWAPRGPPRPPGFLLTFPSSERCVAWALSRGVQKLLIDRTLPVLGGLGGEADRHDTRLPRTPRFAPVERDEPVRRLGRTCEVPVGAYSVLSPGLQA